VNGGFLLDTNIPSELMRPRPEPKVQDWVADRAIGTLFVSVVSIGDWKRDLQPCGTPRGGRAWRHRLSATWHFCLWDVFCR
jgi:hypothetical protein